MSLKNARTSAQATPAPSTDLARIASGSETTRRVPVYLTEAEYVAMGKAKYDSGLPVTALMRAAAQLYLSDPDFARRIEDHAKQL